MRILLYNREAAVQYARKWAINRNPQYASFDGMGGDCTNFLSQCVFAGARVMNYTPTFGWYYSSLQQRAPAWTGVEQFYKFITENKSVGPYGHVVSLEQLQRGDVIQLGSDDGDFYHSLLVLRTEPEITVAAHSIDALDRPLGDYFYGAFRGIHIDGVRNW